jgi:hypothetical protein
MHILLEDRIEIWNRLVWMNGAVLHTLVHALYDWIECELWLQCLHGLTILVLVGRHEIHFFHELTHCRQLANIQNKEENNTGLREGKYAMRWAMGVQRSRTCSSEGALFPLVGSELKV